jgi:DNA polymerase III delta prime subunit
MQTSFIKKYKPKSLQEFCFDDNMLNILDIMKNLHNMNLLFVGNSGNGKTTLINILLENYFGNINNENILYINNLKDQGISYYRTEVKTFCQTSCSVPNKKKIVVIDDIDFINDQSQQVFRNCIDKYGHNIQFLCSCVNTQKVIDSIQSRLSIIKLLPVANSKLFTIMNTICGIEDIILEDDAKDFIVSVSNNSIRTLINYIEKISLLNNNNKAEIKKVKQICTNICFDNFEHYIQLCINNETDNAFEYILSIYNLGFSVVDIYDNFFIFVKSSEVVNETLKYEIIKLLCKYITIFHNIHEHEIELLLFTKEIITMFHA